jgi:cysteinyl-tRNA synthetase
MKLYLTNSLSGNKELFIPIDAKNVRMYVCGPTVYDLIHIGNARSLVVYDLLYRLLNHLYGPNHVTYVRNITDVDDKITKKAKELNISIFELTKKTITDFNTDTQYLGCVNPTHEPKATDNIAQMIEMISNLLAKNCAYIKEGTVYFNITSFSNYGNLSGRKIEELIAGNRIEIDDNKNHPADFVLWKPATNQETSFNSPWGKGMPGWHIECSAMAHRYLGENFDIHGGGVDLIFPHHSNEIAQSCCAFPESSFAKYWVHNGFLKVNSEKMSKSLGNFLTIADVRNQNVSSSAIRYSLLSTHYHKPIDFNQALIHQAKENVNYILRSCAQAPQRNHPDITQEFFNHLLDDLNTHAAFSCLMQMANNYHKTQDNKLKESIAFLCSFLGFQTQKNIENSDISRIKQLIEERAAAKMAKNWSLADSIRDSLKEEGIALEDFKNGPTGWYKID